MTKRRLAELIQVTDRSVTSFESGEFAPDPRTLDRIAETLDYPISFFHASDLDEIPTDSVSFRSLSRMSASQRNAAEAAGSFALGLHDWITDTFKLPPPTIPRLGPGTDPETAAGLVRAEWGLGLTPIPNMIHLLEMHGVRVFSLAEDYREVDAFSFYRGPTPFVFLNTHKSAEHSRMDAAHELGHLVLHAHPEQSAPTGREAEREAQTFGSAFLMPSAPLLASAPRLVTLGSLMSYKRKWRVSLAALIYRMHQIGALSDWQYRTLYVELSKAGWRTTEPQPIQRETSQVIAKVFSRLRKDGVTKDQIAEALHLYPRDLDALVFRLAMLPVTGEGNPGIISRSRPSFEVHEGGAATG